MTQDIFKKLLDELDAWAWTGTPARLWWRDDDAAEPEMALDRLINLTEAHSAPCGLAVIPAKTGEPLRRFVSGCSHIWILQHGFAHVNHAPSGSGAWELGLHRPKDVILDELRQGKNKLSRLFKDHFVPAIVPPWNKIDSDLFPYLQNLGFHGVSASYKRKRPLMPEGMSYADAHCDLLTWKDKEKGAAFVGVERCIEDMVKHLNAKRKGRATPTEPTCVLTHHLEMDEASWEFMEQLLPMVSQHAAAEWVSPADIWPAQ